MIPAENPYAAAYVALSRAKTLGKLEVLNFDPIKQGFPPFSEIDSHRFSQGYGTPPCHRVVQGPDRRLAGEKAINSNALTCYIFFVYFWSRTNIGSNLFFATGKASCCTVRTSPYIMTRRHIYTSVKVRIPKSMLFSILWVTRQCQRRPKADATARI